MEANASTVAAIRTALEAAGVEFIDENGRGAWRAVAEGVSGARQAHGSATAGAGALTLALGHPVSRRVAGGVPPSRSIPASLASLIKWRPP
jgi:hypothetical protein